MTDQITHNGTTVDLDGELALATYPCGHTFALQRAPTDEATRFGFLRGWWRCPVCPTNA